MVGAEQSAGRKRARTPAAAVTLAMLFVLCLAECATGSCLSYGHSCWGAHGKRSGQAPAAAPDWYITRLLQQMVANEQQRNSRRSPRGNSDLDAIFRVEMPEDNSPTDASNSDSDEISSEEISSPKRTMERIPMIDDEVLTKAKLWQIMKATSEEK